MVNTGRDNDKKHKIEYGKEFEIYDKKTWVKISNQTVLENKFRKCEELEEMGRKELYETYTFLTPSYKIEDIVTKELLKKAVEGRQKGLYYQINREYDYYYVKLVTEEELCLGLESKSTRESITKDVVLLSVTLAKPSFLFKEDEDFYGKSLDFIRYSIAHRELIIQEWEDNFFEKSYVYNANVYGYNNKLYQKGWE